MTVLEQRRPVTRFRKVSLNLGAMMSEIRERLGVSPPEDAAAITGNKVQLPQWLFVFLILQSAGAIWWAASLSADVRYLQTDNGKLWQKIEVQDLKLQDAEKHFDERVRGRVKDILEDAGYLRISGGSGR